MKESIKIIIADDNVGFCDVLPNFLKKFEDIEILGIAHNDEEEIKLIEQLKPEIVITDIMRKHKPTGADIIQKYNMKKNAPKFFVISASTLEELNLYNLDIAAYVKKPFFDYDIIVKELRRLKKDIKES